MNNKPFTIVLTGPESSGKTALGQALSMALSSPFIPEYAREYLGLLNRIYQIRDLIHISEMQNESVTEGQKGDSRFLIVDTFTWVMMIWSKIKFGQIPERIKEIHHTTQVDLFILCKPDIPWEEDPLREHPNQRERLYDIHLATLEDSGETFLVVEGNLAERTQKVMEFLGITTEKE